MYFYTCSDAASGGDGSRFFHGELSWFECQGIFFDRNKFGESTDSKVIRPGIDLITRLELPHSRPDSDYDAGHVVTQGER